MTTNNIFSRLTYDSPHIVKWILQNFALIQSMEYRGDVDCIAIKVDVEDAFSHLSSHHQNIIELVYFNNQTQSEVAKLLGITQQGVSGLCDTAINQLMAHLNRKSVK